MDDSKKFNEISTSEKKQKDFYSRLNKEDITDTDCALGKKVCKEFRKRNLGDFFNLYLERDIIGSRCT